MPDKERYEWIPGQRYMYILNIDGKDYFAGRFRRAEGLRKEAQRQSCLKGINPRIIDTKPKTEGKP